MSEYAEIAGKAAGIISFFAFVPYIISILRGKTKPNRASWWIWTGLGMILASSYYASGANHTIWVPVSYLIGPFATAIMSIKFGEGGWTPFDRGCVISAGISLVLWLVFAEPLIALIITLFIDFIGALPTIRKAYLMPETEDKLAWFLFIAGNTVNLFAIESWSFAEAVYPVYMFLGSGIIAFLVLIPRKRNML